MCVAVEWLHAGGAELGGAVNNELLGLWQVALAAKDHHERMHTLAAVGAGADTS
jgi:hypothetical protein